MAELRRLIARTVRAVELIIRDPSLPRPLRWLLGLALLPIPGPLDEAVLLISAPLLLLFRRPAMRRAWRDSSVEVRERCPRGG